MLRSIWGCWQPRNRPASPTKTFCARGFMTPLPVGNQLVDPLAQCTSVSLGRLAEHGRIRADNIFSDSKRVLGRISRENRNSSAHTRAVRVIWIIDYNVRSGRL